MKKLLIPLFILFSFLAKAQTSPVTLQFQGSNPGTSHVDPIRYIYPGKYGGFDTLWNSFTIRNYVAAHTGTLQNLTNTYGLVPFTYTGASPIGLKVDSNLISTIYFLNHHIGTTAYTAIGLRQQQILSAIPSQTLTRPVAGDSVAKAIGKIIKRGDSTSLAVSTNGANIAANTALINKKADSARLYGTVLGVYEKMDSVNNSASTSLQAYATSILNGHIKTFTDGSGVQYVDADVTGYYTGSFMADSWYIIHASPVTFSNAFVIGLANKYIALKDGSGNFPLALTTNATPIYYSGIDNIHFQPQGDGAFFVPELYLTYYNRTADISYFNTNAAAMKQALDNIPLTSHGLVNVDATNTWTPWGFQDGVKSAGANLMGSLLYYRACLIMATLYTANGQTSLATTMTARATAISTNITTDLYDSTDGMFYNSSIRNQQIDILGSAFAVYLGITTSPQNTAIGNYIINNYPTIVNNGFIRQSPINWASSWTYGGVTQAGRGAGNYDDGYWSVGNEWVATAIAKVSVPTSLAFISDFVSTPNKLLEYIPANINTPTSVGASPGLVEGVAGALAFVNSSTYPTHTTVARFPIGATVALGNTVINLGNGLLGTKPDRYQYYVPLNNVSQVVIPNTIVQRDINGAANFFGLTVQNTTAAYPTKTWNTGIDYVNIGLGSAIVSNNNSYQISLYNNFYTNGAAANIALHTGVSNYFGLNSTGGFDFLTAPSVSAGSPITLSSVFGISNTGIITASNLASAGTMMVTASSTGVLGVQAIPSGGSSPSIGGTLTSATLGSVLFAGSAVFAQDNGNFFYDATNHRLGLGTSSPSYPLSVSSGAASETANFTRSNSSTNASLGIVAFDAESTGTPAIGFGAGNVFYANSTTTARQPQAGIESGWSDPIHATRSAYLRFNTVNSGSYTEQMRIQANGGIKFTSLQSGGTALTSSGTLVTPQTDANGLFTFVGNTGTGNVVKSNSPTLTTPVINIGSDATGDIYYRTAGGLFNRLPVGTPLQVLAGGTTPAYSTALTANQVLGANNAGTALEGKTLVAGTNVTITHAANSITIAASGGLSNPMTTLGDLIVGGTAGAATRLAGQTTIATRGFLTQTESGGVANTPVWYDIFGSNNTYSGTTTFSGGAGSIVFNLGGLTQYPQGMLYADGSALLSQASRIKVIGSGATQGLQLTGGLLLSVTSVTATYSILVTDYYLDSNGTFTETLPLAAGGVTGQTYVITNTGSGTITVACTGGQTINGSSTITIAAGVSKTIHSTGTFWVSN